MTKEQVRDTIKERFGYDTHFKIKDVEEALDNRSSQVGKFVRELVDQGTLGRNGALAGPTVRYFFIDPRTAGNGPTTRPRGELRIAPTEAHRQHGQTIPGTGKPEGAAATPGKLKRQQEAAAIVGRKVRPKRVGGVRL